MIDLANTAAESVLRFHIAASKLNKPFVAIKAFKSAIHRTISQSVVKKKNRKTHDDFQVSLLHVASLAGDAAFRSATEWNSISHPE